MAPKAFNSAQHLDAAELPRLLDRRILERVADAGEDLVAERFVAGPGERRLGVARMLLAFLAQLVDQRRAIAFETRVLERRGTRRLGSLGNRRVELALCRQPQSHRILRR